MSDYYGNPISIPPNIQALTPQQLGGLYQPTLNQLAGQIPSAGSVAGVGSIPGAGFIPEAAASGGGLFSRFAMQPGLNLTSLAGAKAVAGKALPPLLLSQLATGAINSALPSEGSTGTIRQVAADTATGAGIGAAIAAPTVIGTPVGAAIGGGVGALYAIADNIFGFGGGDNTPDFRKGIEDSASKLGLDPNQYSAAYDVLTQAGGDKKAIAGQLAQQLLQDSAAKQQQDLAIKQAQWQRGQDQQFALAMQAQAAKFFTPYVNNIVSAGAAEANLLGAQADKLPEPYRGVFQAQAQQALTQANRLAGAYAAQAALLPSQYMYSQDLKRQQELAQLQYQQSVVNAQQGGGGGSQDITALAKQLQGAGG